MKCKELRFVAVRYYLRSDKSIAEVCDIFELKKSSLVRWIKQYRESVQKKGRKSLSYKVKQKHVKKALLLLKENEQITMKEQNIYVLNQNSSSFVRIM